jgi:hypothetical protein
MYNLTKWLGDTANLGIQISPSLGTARYRLAYAGATLRKVGGEIKVGLQVWGWCPPPCSIDDL